MESFARVILFSFFSVSTLIVFQKINEKQANAYMDEIFHIRQAQSYCNGNFTHWDDKITTLPGLYLVSQVFLEVASLGQREKLCTPFNLRITNYALILGCVLVLRSLLNKLKLKENIATSSMETKLDVLALTYSTFPLLYFFTFLYYTDVGSTFFVLLAYLFSLQNRHFLASFSVAVSILFRQTNIIWLLFIAATSCLRHLKERKVFEDSSNIITDLVKAVWGCFVHFAALVLLLWPYLLVVVGFATFVSVNDGIVVGDRSSHEATLNFPQMFYFSVFTLLFSAHILLRYFYTDSLKRIVTFFTLPYYVLATLVAVMVVWKFTTVHKYLLADNRHYTFYVWRRILDRHAYARYAFVPVYCACLAIIRDQLIAANNQLWVLVYFACTCVVLTPQKLLEFRYFIVPYLLFKLHIPVSSCREIFVELSMYALINIFTFYLFLNRPFYWSNEPDAVQRFMW